MTDAVAHIARILRTDKDAIKKIDSHLSVVTGKRGVIDKIVEQNSYNVRDRLQSLGVGRGSAAKDVYDALISKIESDDNHLYEAFGRPQCDSQEDCDRVIDIVKSIAKSNHGWFLKEEKAREFLSLEPPKRILSYFGYGSVDEMLAKENLYEVYSALRFIEDAKWMNEVFLKQYNSLTPDDFEERDVVVQALDTKWNDAAEQFVQKKWHNISHLKELGTVFVIPISLGISGELLRMIGLVLHYLYEVSFYSDMFRRSAEVPAMFAENLISLLRGDVIDRRIPEGDKTLWFVIQQYLAKNDENDWRLFVPHINPETYHWLRAEKALVSIGTELDGFSEDFLFWNDLDWVGEYFRNETGNEVLVSFDLVDTVMSLVKEKEMIKYLYHHQEALWNKIFTEYFGQDQLEHFMKEYLLQGYFEV